MRIVLAIDGELLVPGQDNSGIPGQKSEISSVVAALEGLISSDHEVIITHGNAPQVGFVLLRSEAASHIIHRTALDICGADTQGATGYMLQQAIHNQLEKLGIHKDVCTLVTQVLVAANSDQPLPPRRGVGPYYDRDKAVSYTNIASWEFIATPGFGFRRAVPCLMPDRILELNTILRLVSKDCILICAGGGGVPVKYDENGMLTGLEAVIDKATTTGLLASEIGADGVIFISQAAKIETFLGGPLPRPAVRLEEQHPNILPNRLPGNDDMQNKFYAAWQFFETGGKWVVITTPELMAPTPDACGGIWLEPETHSRVSAD